MEQSYRTERLIQAPRGSITAEGGRTYCVMAMPDPPQEQPETETQPRQREKKAPRSILRVFVGLLLTGVIITSPAWLTVPGLLPVMKRLSASSASMKLPEYTAVSPTDTVQTITTRTTSATTTAAAAATAAPTTTAPSQSTEGMLPVAQKQVDGSGTRVGDIYVKNSTGYTPDFAKLLKADADCRIKLDAGPQVLIVHTHTTEGYAQRNDGFYDPDYSPRTTDSSRNMIAVGEVLAKKLEEAGVRTVHATETHDHPKYNGSYERALETIKKYLEQYPSIEMVLDVHRDAVTYNDGTKLKPTVEINGRSAAQIMIISGCDAGGKLYFPEWKSNLTMALQLQQRAHELYPGLMRPLSFAPYRYNMHMTPNSLLLEFGTDANTLEEALCSAELMGDVLVDTLLRYNVDK